ncbi:MULTISPECIES: CheR family methyltransferase [Calothrix]|uniref:Chemotaxis protein n=2 Tax=Calothrix TaxID=1186 RepID=A0ABR8AB79_9CYAN|nr:MULTISPECIES: protein-glutamate O-methyltransferase CheR [Calothrix]MBD2197064.1 chemotaxis protein [Calothrix parietina FACHB-288]MBD2225715.1 chemotaxis protein [Calothrix anomala FACHB-343]
MTYSAGEALLKEKIGLDANSIGAGAIANVIAQRMAACKITHISSYLEYLQQSPAEWEALIDIVIVPETWFFREPETFAILQQYISSQWLLKQPQRVLRVLSVPCATGEEPYSIAIALLEAGLSATKIHIDAVDISKQCLLKAQRAIYDRYSFRGNSLDFQWRYFQPTESGYRLREQIKSMVNFIHGNLADPNFLIDQPPYDIIFCRNLLIYFDQAFKEQTLRVLERLITIDGLLFVAHAEAGLLLQTKFNSWRKSSVITYQKMSKQQSLKDKIYLPIKESLAVAPQNKIIVNDLQTNLLETAQAAADRGCLDEAVKLCRKYLNENQMSVEAYVLMGEVQQAMGNNEQAVQYFHKAIYLQPTHKEALTHLALLKEHQGDVASANLLWQRIQRLDQKEA